MVGGMIINEQIHPTHMHTMKVLFCVIRALLMTMGDYLLNDIHTYIYNDLLKVDF